MDFDNSLVFSLVIGWGIVGLFILDLFTRSHKGGK